MVLDGSIHQEKDQGIVPVFQVKIFVFKKPKPLPWTSPKFLNLIFFFRGLAFIFLSFEGCSWIAHWTSTEKWNMYKFFSSEVLLFWCFFFTWSHDSTGILHICAVKMMVVMPWGYIFHHNYGSSWQTVTGSSLPFLLWSPISKSPHTDHLELLGSAAHYLISNVNWLNIHSCQRHAVPFPSVHWFGTQASPRFQPSTAPE